MHMPYTVDGACVGVDSANDGNPASHGDVCHDEALPAEVTPAGVPSVDPSAVEAPVVGTPVVEAPRGRRHGTYRGRHRDTLVTRMNIGRDALGRAVATRMATRMAALTFPTIGRVRFGYRPVVVGAGFVLATVGMGGVALATVGMGGAAFAGLSTAGGPRSARMTSALAARDDLPTSVARGNPPTAVAVGSAVTVAWAASTMRSAPVIGYQATRYASSGDTHTPRGSCTSSGTALSCVEHGVPDGVWRYAVRPLAAGNELGDEGDKGARVTVSTVRIAFPAAQGWYRLDGFAAGCDTPQGDVCGIASTEPGRGIAGVAVSIRRGNGAYWNPSTGFTSGTEVLVPAVTTTLAGGAVGGAAGGTAGGAAGGAAGSVRWTLPMPQAALKATAPYSVRVVVTDTAGRFAFAQSDFVVVPPSIPTVTYGPADPTDLTAATFSFATAQPGLTFVCSIDDAPAVACQSPWVVTGPVSDGAHQFRVRAVDAAGNPGVAATRGWSVDTVHPALIDVQADDHGRTTGKIEQDDTLTLTYSEPVTPGSILAGWHGDTTAVDLRVTAAAAGHNDQIAVYAVDGVTPLGALGTVDLGQDGYVSRDVTIPATMRMSGTRIVITMRAPQHADESAFGTVTSAGTMRWREGSGTDAAGNLLDVPAAGVAEDCFGAIADRDF